MECARFQEALFERLESRTDRALDLRMRAHTADCRDCRELEAILATGAGLGELSPPAELVDVVIAGTTGGSCDRAQALLSESVGAPPSGVDAALRMHVEACSSCASFERALQRLVAELPALAELEPDAGFVADVMAATVGAATPLPWYAAARIGEVRDRAAAFWDRLAQRPRLALEGAYFGMLAMLLLVGLPSVSPGELSVRAFEQIRRERVEVGRVVVTNLDRLADLGASTWATSTGRVGEYVESSTGVPAGVTRIGAALRSWARSVYRFVADQWAAGFKTALERIRSTREGRREGGTGLDRQDAAQGAD